MTSVQSEDERKSLRASLFIHAIAIFWVGLIIGVSFIATPAKFAATTLSLPVALDVGRQTFGLFNKIEWLVFAAFLGPVLFVYRTRFVVVLAIVIGGILAIETFWVLPQLDKRVELIMAGQVVERSVLHTVYVMAEVLKCAFLFVIAGFGLLQQRA